MDYCGNFVKWEYTINIIVAKPKNSVHYKILIDLMADLGYDIIAIVVSSMGGFNKGLVGITKYNKK